MEVGIGMEKKLFKSFRGLAAILLICVLIFPSCTSTPKVDSQRQLGEGKYQIELDRDYDKNDQERTYAIEQFVKSVGGTSYSLERDRSNYIVTIPGDIPVRDVPLKRHYHAGRTALLVTPIAVAGGFLVYLGATQLIKN
jgi:hypothetical protein